MEVLEYGKNSTWRPVDLTELEWVTVKLSDLDVNLKFTKSTEVIYVYEFRNTAYVRLRGINMKFTTFKVMQVLFEIQDGFY